jgi:D-alanyl-lipoteichoic acid biosynthesis protein DltD
MARLHHTISALLSVCIIGCVLVCYEHKAKLVRERFIYSLAGKNVALKFAGDALDRTALKQKDLLPVVGASEILVQNSHYRSSVFFRSQPTGFQVFEIARAGAASLTLAQVLAGMATELKGHQVVVSYSPFLFEVNHVNSTNYARSFSRLHAYQITYANGIHLTTRMIAADQMLNYRRTLSDDPLVLFSLHRLAKGKPIDKALYFASLPLGKLFTWGYEVQDDLGTMLKMQHMRLSDRVRRTPAAIDWDSQMPGAVKIAEKRTADNEFGYDNNLWKKYHPQGIPETKAGSGDKDYLSTLRSTQEWKDFDLMLRVLRDIGAKPLILGRPIKGMLYDAMGTSLKAREHFYTALRNKVSQYHFPLVDFSDKDQDRYFVIDVQGHTSSVGWVYVNRILDSFFHGILS